MGKTVRDVLVDTLENLGKRGFKKFKLKLNEWEITNGYKSIPKSQLEKADEDDVAGLIISHYTESYGIEVALGVLKDNGEMEAYKELERSVEKVKSLKQGHKASDQKEPPKGDHHFINKHRKQLIERMSDISAVLDDLLFNTLTQEQYDTIRSKGTDQEKMRQLYVYIKSWGDIEKDKLYQSLKENNSPLIRDLENS